MVEKKYEKKSKVSGEIESANEKANGPDKKASMALEDPKMNIKVKLAGLWIVLVLIYIYVDIISFFTPGVIENILIGKVWVLDITQAWALSAIIMMLIPIFMVFMSLALPAKPNRIANLVAGNAYIFVGLGTMTGETWAYYILGHTMGILVLAGIVLSAWKWPKQKGVPAESQEMESVEYSVA